MKKKLKAEATRTCVTSLNHFLNIDYMGAGMYHQKKGRNEKRDAGGIGK